MWRDLAKQFSVSPSFLEILLLKRERVCCHFVWREGYWWPFSTQPGTDDWLISHKKNNEKSRWGLNLKFPSRFQLSILKFPCFHIVRFRLARPLTLWPGRRRCQGCEELSPTKPQKLPLIFFKKYIRKWDMLEDAGWVEFQEAKIFFQFGRDIVEKNMFLSMDGLLPITPVFEQHVTKGAFWWFYLSLWFWETDQRWLGLLTPRAKQWKTVGFREGQAFSAAFATKVTRVQLTRLKGAFACGNSCGPQEFKIDLTVLTWSCPSCLWDDQDGSCLMDLFKFRFLWFHVPDKPPFSASKLIQWIGIIFKISLFQKYYRPRHVFKNDFLLRIIIINQFYVSDLHNDWTNSHCPKDHLVSFCCCIASVANAGGERDLETPNMAWTGQFGTRNAQKDPRNQSCSMQALECARKFRSLLPPGTSA